MISFKLNPRCIDWWPCARNLESLWFDCRYVMLLRTNVTHLITLILLYANALTLALLIKRENFKKSMSVISCQCLLAYEPYIKQNDFPFYKYIYHVIKGILIRPSCEALHEGYWTLKIITASLRWLHTFSQTAVQVHDIHVIPSSIDSKGYCWWTKVQLEGKVGSFASVTELWNKNHKSSLVIFENDPAKGEKWFLKLVWPSTGSSVTMDCRHMSKMNFLRSVENFFPVYDNTKSDFLTPTYATNVNKTAVK